jgi:GT2 family glycosyltransferase
MYRIAVLLTSFNRKEKTLRCLASLYEAQKAYTGDITLKVFITDDNSKDNTASAVKDLFPEIIVLSGNGNLFWAGGMRNSWQEALKEVFDGYLLLNDDVILNSNLFQELTDAINHGLQQYQKDPIFIGSTEDGKGNLTYGGSIITSKLLNTYKRLIPDNAFQECDTANANIMYVPQSIVNQMGIFSEKYTHGLADYDYTLSAKRYNIPVLTSRVYCGFCLNDNTDKYSHFVKLNFIDRVKFINHPKGLAFRDQLTYMQKYFPFRLPIICFGAAMKLLFPKVYLLINVKRQSHEK